MLKKLTTTTAIFLFSTSLIMAEQGDAIVSRNYVGLDSNNTSKNLSEKNLDSQSQYLYTPKKVRQVSGLYVGAQIGGATLNSDNSAFATSTSSSITRDNGNLYTGITLGYNYALNDMFGIGLESGINYGYQLAEVSVTGQSADISVTTIPMLFTGSWMFSSGFNLFAKIGAAYVRESNSGFNSTTLTASNGDGTANALNFAFGIGAGYFINNFNIKIEYNYISGDSKPTNDSSTFPINALTLGVTYTFPSAI